MTDIWLFEASEGCTRGTRTEAIRAPPLPRTVGVPRTGGAPRTGGVRAQRIGGVRARRTGGVTAPRAETRVRAPRAAVRRKNASLGETIAR